MKENCMKGKPRCMNATTATQQWCKSLDKMVGNQRNSKQHFTSPLMKASMKYLRTKWFYLNLSNRDAQDGLLWAIIIMLSPPINLKAVFMAIHSKLLEN